MLRRAWFRLVPLVAVFVWACPSGNESRPEDAGADSGGDSGGDGGLDGGTGDGGDGGTGDAGGRNVQLRFDVSTLDFGMVSVGDRVDRAVQVHNDGTEAVSVSSFSVSGDAFLALPPWATTLAPQGVSEVVLRFSPAAVDGFTGALDVEVTGLSGSSATLALRGEGVPVAGTPDISAAAAAVDFGIVRVAQRAVLGVALQNRGDGLGVVEDGTLAGDEMKLLTPLPLAIPPGESETVLLEFQPQKVGAVEDVLALTGSLGGEVRVATAGRGIELSAFQPLSPPTRLGLPASPDNLENQVTAVTARAAFFEVGLPDTFQGGDRIEFSVRDRQGVLVERGFSWPSGLSGTASTSVDLSVLSDGALLISARFARGPQGAELFSEGRTLDAVKQTAGLAPPIVDLLPNLVSVDRLVVTGTAAEGALVTIDGGAGPVSVQLGAGETVFSAPVVLRRNAENKLQICHEVLGVQSCAVFVSVVHLVPDEFVIAEARSRRLSVEEVEVLVENGVVALDDPENFHVSEFTVVIEVAGTQIPVSQPVVLGNAPGVYFGAAGTAAPGGSGTGGGSGGGFSGGGGSSRRYAQVVVVQPPMGLPPIPGVIFIEGRVKSLKEMFQVTFLLSNLSEIFQLENVTATLLAPTGLTPIRAALGDAVEGVEVDGPIDEIVLGTIAPALPAQKSEGLAQFIVRGDVAGDYTVEVSFGGVVTGPGLTEPVPFDGQVNTGISVFGPPTFDIHLTHPASVTVGQTYDLVVAVTNTAPIPAPFASLDLAVGAGASLAQDGCPAPVPSPFQHFELGHLEPGQTREQSLRLVACTDGPVIGCKVRSDEVLNVSVSAGAPCPTEREIVPSDLPDGFEAPVVVGIAPTPNTVVPHQGVAIEVALSRSVVNIFSDVFVDGRFSRPGTIVVERLNLGGSQVLERVASTSSVTYNAQDDRTVVRLDALDLTPDGLYRVTVVGAQNGVRNALSGTPLRSSFVYTFRTEMVDDGLAPTVLGTAPEDGAADVLGGSPISVEFSERIDGPSISVHVANYLLGTFAVVSGATQVGEDIQGGQLLSGAISLSPNGRTLTFVPDPPLPQGGSFFIRVRGVRDVFGTELAGTHLAAFSTGPADTVPPPAPTVDPISRFTAASSVVVSGTTEPYATVNITGGARPVSARSGASGRFLMQAPLTANQDNSLSVSATDFNGNIGPSTMVDEAGAPLVSGRDRTAPTVRIEAPNEGSVVQGPVVVQYASEDAFGPGVNLVQLTSEGFLVAEGTEASGELRFNSEIYENGDRVFLIWARDAVGNWSSSGPARTLKVANPEFPRLDAVVPSSFYPGTTTELLLRGANLDDLTAVTVEPPEASVELVGASGFDYQVRVTVPQEVPTQSAVIIAQNAFGSSRSDDEDLGVFISAPPLTVDFAQPERLLTRPSGRTISVTGSGFLPSSEVVVQGLPLSTTILSSTSLQFELPQEEMSVPGLFAFSVRTPDPVLGFRFSNQGSVLRVKPSLSFGESDISLLPGAVRLVEVRLSEVAEAGGYRVDVAFADASGVATVMPETIVIPEGANRADATVTTLGSGGPVTLNATAPLANPAQLAIEVIAPPVIEWPPSPLVLQPLLESTFTVGLSRPAPTDGLRTDLSVSPNGGVGFPAMFAFPFGSISELLSLTGQTPGDYTLTATPAAGAPAMRSVAVRQAVASSSPPVIKAAALRNEVQIRVATDGAGALSRVTVEVPSGWSPPELASTQAVLGNGTDVSASLVRGDVGQGPNGGTVMDLTLPAPILVADASPYLDLVFSNMTAFEVLGRSTWHTEVDTGSGLVPVQGHPEVMVSGTAADGSGTVVVSTDPAPLVAGASSVFASLSLSNNVEVVTDAATIFSSWSQQGTDLNWGLLDHATFGTILRTPVNSNPGYFISEDALSNGTIEVEIGALTSSDDDFIGLVFRWQDTCNFYLLDWKQGTQSNGGQVATRGLALRRIRDCDFDGDGGVDNNLGFLWGNEISRSNVLATNADQGWSDNTFHALRVVLAGADITIFVDGVQRIATTDATGFTSGRYGPYSFSQPQTSIRNLRVSRAAVIMDTIEWTVPTGWPVAPDSTLSLTTAGTDRTAEIVTSSTSAGESVFRLNNAQLLPGQAADLRFLNFTAPPAGRYDFVVRTAGVDGDLTAIAAPPAIDVSAN